MICSPLMAGWIIPTRTWWNSGTGQVYYNGYPTGVSTFTPTATSFFTFTFTPTPSFTATPTFTGTWTQNLTFTNTRTFTPTPTFTTTFTPVLYAGTDVVLSGKYIGSQQSGAISWASGQATYDLTSHGFSVGDWVAIGYATPGAYNILAPITSKTNNTFTYAVGGSPTTVSSGASTLLFWFPLNRVVNPEKIKSIEQLGMGDYSFDFLNTQTNDYYGFDGASASAFGAGLLYLIGPTSPITMEIDSISPSNTAFDPNNYFYLKLSGIQ